MKSAATLIELIMVSLASPGWVLKPWKVTVIESAEKVSTSSMPRVWPSSV